ncbi:MAG: hypothetical protein BroJett003_25980 [Planctomycetota bacterium]|nr:MAG: hypothetical protein BroJett003_25980 [Planctomycetota bacterium]
MLGNVFAAFHRHGAIGADALDDLVPRMTAGLPEAAADDAVEGIGEAITKSYRDKFPLEGPIKDEKALTTVSVHPDAGRTIVRTPVCLGSDSRQESGDDGGGTR